MSREDRAEDREETAPRRKRIPLGVPQQRLSAPVRKGFMRRWINDTPGRISRARDAGYQHVRDQDQKGDDGRPAPRKEVVGVNPDGSPLVAYLMEIPQSYYEEDQRAKQAPLDQFDAQLKRGIVRKADAKDRDNFYVPKEGIQVRTD